MPDKRVSDMPDDEIRAAMEEIGHREEAVHIPFSPHRCCELSQKDVSPLLAALRVALKIHAAGCLDCLYADDEHRCPTYRAVAAEPSSKVVARAPGACRP